MMHASDEDPAAARRTWRSVAGAAACIAVVIGVIAFVAARIIPETPEGPSALAEHFGDLSFPESLEVVVSGTIGGGPAFFGERAAAVQVYAASESPDVVCRTIEEPLSEWGTLLGGSAGSTGGCGYNGRVAKGSQPEFQVEVLPREVYMQRAGSGDVYWEGAATSSSPTVVEIEILS